jgi:hypothetical protein
LLWPSIAPARSRDSVALGNLLKPVCIRCWDLTCKKKMVSELNQVKIKDNWFPVRCCNRTSKWSTRTSSGGFGHPVESLSTETLVQLVNDRWLVIPMRDDLVPFHRCLAGSRADNLAEGEATSRIAGVGYSTICSKSTWGGRISMKRGTRQ